MKNQLHTSRKRQLGLSMVEISIAAVVISTALIGLLAGLPKLQLDMRLNTARQEIPAVLNAITAAYATQPNTMAASTQILSAAGVWPSHRVIDSGLSTVRVNGVFPGSREYAFNNATEHPPRLASAHQGFMYWLQNVPKEACLPLVQLLVSQRAVAEVSVDIGTKVPNEWRAATVVTTFAGSTLTVNMVSATTACSTPGNKTIAAAISRA